MKIYKLLLILLISFCLFACGNKKSNTLREGVVDKSSFPFPPDPNYNYPEEID